MKTSAQRGCGWSRGVVGIMLVLVMAGGMGPNARAQTPSSGLDPSAVRIAAIVGPSQVELLLPGATTWVLTQTNQMLTPGCQLRTGPNTRVLLRWSDQSVVTFGPLSEAEILAPQTAGSESGLHLLRGILSFFHREKPGRIRVLSRGTTAGVEGTEFVVVTGDVVGNANAALDVTFYLIDGRVGLANADGALTLTNGQSAVAGPGRAPQLQTAGFIANNVLQWCLYYPAVLDLTELPFTPAEMVALEPSIVAYRSGDLLNALARFPAGRLPVSDAERIYQAALLLSIGRVVEAEGALAGLPAGDPAERLPRLANALRVLVAAVKRTPAPATAAPELATELLAASYFEQSRAVRETALRSALHLARRATTNSPAFGFAWARVAELEFGFGRTARALAAASLAHDRTPGNAQAMAVKGFLLAGQNRIAEAKKWFERAIAADGALGNGWLGRGLCRMQQGDPRGGHEDLLVAAALEPQRALLRSYLGKSYSGLEDLPRALHELQLAKELDPSDPTAWLYSALVKERAHRLNEAVDELERSKELNDNRLLYRSKLLLDQDRAVRSANLARTYADAGLSEVAVREAARSVADDYGNYSAHYFLANSYNNLRRANRADLRFETAAVSEYLLANLLGPAEGSLLAQPISQQEYTRLFKGDYFGFSSDTEYLSRGAWTELAVQYGTFGNSSYALELDYLRDPGQVKNSGYEQKVGSISFKHMLTPRDGVYVEAIFQEQTTEDIAVRYDPNDAVAGYKTRERKEPALLVGFDHQWNEGQRTLLLGAHIDDSPRLRNPYSAAYLVQEIFGSPTDFIATDLTQNYENRLRLDSIELQHIARGTHWQTIAGVRYQEGANKVSNAQSLEVYNASGVEIYFGAPGDTITNQTLRLTTRRLSSYLYQHWEILDSVWLIGGISYDYQEQPRNLTAPPFSDRMDYLDQVSPKAGFVWTPWPQAVARGAYTRSLGGADLESGVRIEPSQIAGFVQSYRDVVPASLGYANVAGNRVETADLSLENRFPTRTYVAVSGQLLRSAAEHDVGIWWRDLFTSSGPGRQSREHIRFQERSMAVSAHQLLGDLVSVGLRYRLADARLNTEFKDPSLPANLPNRSRGLLHTLAVQPLVRHPSGFFAGAEALWWAQDLQGDLDDLKNDEVWQANVFVGFRSPRRRFEVSVGLLNVTDQDYRIHPVNLYAELPRERTFFTRFIINF